MDHRLTRHDWSLAAIAISLLVGLLAGLALPVGTWMAVGAGSLPATGGVSYALFYKPPTKTR